MTCRRCRKPLTAHCPDCQACPGHECPYWCAANDDPYGNDPVPVDLKTWIHVNTRKF